MPRADGAVELDGHGAALQVDVACPCTVRVQNHHPVGRIRIEVPGPTDHAVPAIGVAVNDLDGDAFPSSHDGRVAGESVVDGPHFPMGEAAEVPLRDPVGDVPRPGRCVDHRGVVPCHGCIDAVPPGKAHLPRPGRRCIWCLVYRWLAQTMVVSAPPLGTTKGSGHVLLRTHSGWVMTFVDSAVTLTSRRESMNVLWLVHLSDANCSLSSLTLSCRCCQDGRKGGGGGGGGLGVLLD